MYLSVCVCVCDQCSFKLNVSALHGRRHMLCATAAAYDLPKSYMVDELESTDNSSCIENNEGFHETHCCYCHVSVTTEVLLEIHLSK